MDSEIDIHIINKYISAFYKIILFVLGTIGNLLFIHLVYRRKQLRSRTSILQCFQCFFHLFCSFGTLQNDVFDIGITHIKSECYERIAFYVFFQAAQGLLMLIIVLDMLILVKFPIRYRTISLTDYMMATTIPILSFSIFTTVYGYLGTNEKVVTSCSPKTAFNINASIFYKYLYIALAFVVLVFYLVLIREFQKKSQTQNSYGRSLKTMKRLQFTVVLFILTWLSSQVFGLVILKTSAYYESELVRIVMVHDALFVCLSYSNTFYVAILRSEEYRLQFYNLWIPKKVACATITPANSQKALDQNTIFQKRNDTI